MVSTMLRPLLYFEFETCVAHSIDGGGTKTQRKSRFCLQGVLKRGEGCCNMCLTGFHGRVHVDVRFVVKAELALCPCTIEEWQRLKGY